MLNRPAGWSGRKVLVTGHTGFKGGWLSLWLQHLGAQVAGYALAPPTTPSLFEVAKVGAGMRSTLADVRDLQELSREIAEFRPEIVFHMAAQPLVRSSYADPVETYATNVMGTVHVLEAVRLAGTVKAVVVVTSDKCYENKEWVWGYRESDPMGGRDPYSNSKGCAELVTASYRQSFFTPPGPAVAALASARAGNVIGGGDWAADRLVPDFLRAMSAGQSIHVRHPNAQRPWQHVLEPLSGYLMLAERLLSHSSGQFADGWNFGPRDEDALTVSALIERLSALWGGASFSIDKGPHPHEATFLKLDCSKAKALLGWEPRTRVDTALQWTVEWYKSYRSGADMREVTLAQVEKFQSIGADLP